MIDEDLAIAVLEGLMARHPDPVVALRGAMLIRPRADRIAVLGGLDREACTAAQRAGVLPDDAAWWLSLTTWGRLEMWGDVAAAGAWLRDQSF